jgi:flagellar protein FliT
MDNIQIVSLYETVAELTDQMLLAARAGDWDKLIELEQDCSSKVQVLKDQDPVALTPEPLLPELRDKKVRFIKKILADDKEIRDLTEPWMAELSNMIQSSGTNRKLSNSYGSHA